MKDSKPTHRVLQQQPQYRSDRQQQQSSGSGEYQPKASDGANRKPKQMGEGSYEGTENYQKSIKTYLEKADVKADAQAAKPAGSAEAEELKRAEEEGRSHSKAKGE
ncbi:MAG: hypothetical protein V4731_12760 [Pseudomonadota bacterium]